MKELIQDAAFMHRALTRMCSSEDTVVFPNASGEFKLIMRCAPAMDDDVFLLELGAVVDEHDGDTDDEEDGSLHKVFENAFDEHHVYELALEEVRHDATEEDLEEVRRLINKCYNYSLCPCGAYLIKDGGEACVFCQLTATASTWKKGQMCPICHEMGRNQHMVSQKCCGQKMHKACLNKWSQFGTTCPTCRG